MQIVAVYAFKQSDAERFLELFDLDPKDVDVYSGSAGYKTLLARSDIQAVVLDVHAKLMVCPLSRLNTRPRVPGQLPIHLPICVAPSR